MPRTHLTVATLVRNEANRFLPSALRCWQSFADSIVFLDDNSTDNTRDLAAEAGAIVHRRDASPMWGEESLARQQLWDLALEHTPDGGHVLFLDADMIPARNPRDLLQGNCDAWAFPLYDLWEEKRGKLYYREDNYWCGHLHPRIWLIRKPSVQDWAWNARGIHCGHLPLNYSVRAAGIAPLDMSLLHFAYLTPELRREKGLQYGKTERIMSPFEVRHAQSITDASPRLLPLPFTPQYTLTREVMEVQNVA